MRVRPHIGSLVVIKAVVGHYEEQVGMVIEPYGHPSYWDYWILIGDEKQVFCAEEFEEL